MSAGQCRNIDDGRVARGQNRVRAGDPGARHLVPTRVHPRLFVTADVTVTDVLDLRTAGARASAGLTLGDLQSRVEEYDRCQRVAQVAHQLGRHGIIAPAATDMGQTLALFTDLTDAAGQQPARGADDVLWETLPPNPRMPGARGRLSVVRDDD